ncbi:MAG: 8-amino-7-oxononanoate synthase [Oleiphilaceae bacterium]|nr:8-amino-7-oxononanoate synthase [Oleiphilaceae bacterium]
METFEDRWRSALAARADADLMRARRHFAGAQSVHLRLAGRDYISFASNDYLGLAGDSELREKFAQAVARTGVGSGASHMVCGHHEEHHALELELATFTGRDKALVFSSGYAANLAVLGTLASRKDVILQDKLNHASLLDGANLSGARSQRFLHGNVSSLQSCLQRFAGGDKAGTNVLVATDGVFSMDGDLAPLPEMVAACQPYHALMVVDDAHGMGVLGDEGRGTLQAFGLTQTEVPVLIGTFGKAFGTAGAFVAGPALLMDYLEQFARPYIYTTAMPPALAAVTRHSLRLVVAGDARRSLLQQRISQFKQACAEQQFELMPSDTAIQPLVVGSSGATMKLGAFLEQHGLLTGQIRPPTVPEGKARLRITLSSAHSENDILRLIQTLIAARQEGLV